jgi:hypothetical protein
MATILDKDITRETTVKVDDREIQITLTDKQTIFMKLKGLKTGGLEVGIVDLFNQLKGGEVKSEPVKEVEQSRYKGGVDLSSYKGDDRFLISLHDIRSYVLVKDIDFDVKIKFERILVDLINERKQRNKV